LIRGRAERRALVERTTAAAGITAVPIVGGIALFGLPAPAKVGEEDLAIWSL